MTENTARESRVPLFIFVAFMAASLIGIGYLIADAGGVFDNPVEEAREILATELYDAESAQFRDVVKSDIGTYCGQVNAKNLMGAYVGYRPFYIGVGGIVFIDNEDRDSASRLCANEEILR